MKKYLRNLCVALLLLLCIGSSLCGTVSAAANVPQSLIPGGIPFGVKFTTDGILIVGFCDIENGSELQNPAKAAGLKIKDLITHVEGEEITDAESLTRKINESGGKALTVTYRRGVNTGKTTLTPLPDPAGNGYKTGLYVRDSGAGIGTVTFFDPAGCSFAGLGHGICDVDTGELMPLRRGSVVDVTISGVNRGVAGCPGELKGYFGTGKAGTLLGNTPCGVYGVLATVPQALSKTAPVAVATREEVHDGSATILCTLSSNERCEYSAEISSIDRNAHGSKCFAVRVTDPTLLRESGGIVQGMSGSPILQDGKLIGAVTHVLINNPASGYGIFIENMLAEMPDLLK